MCFLFANIIIYILLLFTGKMQDYFLIFYDKWQKIYKKFAGTKPRLIFARIFMRS